MRTTLASELLLFAHELVDCVLLADGEALLPVVITLAYVASQDSFPQILLVASIAQLAAYGGARAAAGGLEASKRRAADSATEARTAADGVAMSNAVTTVA